jgi:hypothetical protein
MPSVGGSDKYDAVPRIGTLHPTEDYTENGQALTAFNAKYVELQRLFSEVQVREIATERENECLKNELKLTSDALHKVTRNFDETQRCLVEARREKEALFHETSLLREGNQSLSDELMRFESAYEQCRSLLRDNYEIFVPTDVLRVLNISPETLGKADSTVKYAVLLTYLGLASADERTFTVKFQDFDSELAKLRQLSDFGSIRQQAEEAINARFQAAGYVITWGLEGHPFDAALHCSASGQGTTVTDVDRALIKRGDDVIVKAYVSTV